MKLLKIMQDSKRFSYTEQNIINYMIENHKILANLSIRELSKKTFASPASIFRLCQKLGFRGYSEFKIQFMIEMSRMDCEKLPTKRPITNKDSPEDVLQKMTTLHIEAIAETRQEINLEQLIRIADMIAEANIVDIYAYDQNFFLAQAACHNLTQIQCNAITHQTMNNQFAQALKSDSSHVAIIISRTGENKKLIRAAEILRKRKVKIILLSASKETTLAKKCDEFLYIANTIEYLDLGATIFSVGVNYYFDVIFGLFLARNYIKTDKFYNELENYIGRINDPNRIW